MQNQSKESPRPRYGHSLHMRKVSSRPQSPSFLGHVVLKRGAHYKFNLGDEILPSLWLLSMERGLVIFGKI